MSERIRTVLAGDYVTWLQPASPPGAPYPVVRMRPAIVLQANDVRARIALEAGTWATPTVVERIVPVDQLEGRASRPPFHYTRGSQR